MTNHYTDVCETTIETLRQTVERQAAQIEMMREVLEFMWRDVPMNDYAFERCEKAISTTPGQALEQFAATIAACKAKDEALDLLLRRSTRSKGYFIEAWEGAHKALAIQPDDAALKAYVSKRIASTFRKKK